MNARFRIQPQPEFNFGELVIDNFAGGGASTGIEQALGRPVDIAINHDLNAIRMHEITLTLPSAAYSTPSTHSHRHFKKKRSIVFQYETRLKYVCTKHT